MKEMLRHKLPYAVLALLVVVFVVLFIGAWPDRRAQRLLILAFSTSYLVWGITTHVRASRLTRGIFFEYLAMSVLAAVALLVITI